MENVTEWTEEKGTAGANIDDLKFIKSVDVSDMLGLVLAMPEHILAGIAAGKKAKLPEASKIKNILITGLGGSAIGGDVLRCFLSKRCSVPIAVNRNYHIPAYVGENTLVVAISYSGGTEETLSACKEALEKKASVITITSGGKIKEVVTKAGGIVVEVPGGFSPRAALGHLFFPLALIVSRLGLAEIPDTELEETVKVLVKMRENFKPEVATAGNLAKQLANKLFAKAVIVYGSADFTEVVANRWKCQLAENAKVFAMHSVIPEMNHNEIVGWDLLRKVLRKFAVVFIRDKQDDPKIQKRADITKAMLGKRANWAGEVHSIGESPLARLFSLIYLGDFTSVYLSLLYGIDPTPIQAINHFKEELAK